MIKRIFAVTSFLCLMMFKCVFAQTEVKLWYQQPATSWTEALPIGNGRLGAMVFGKVEEELIQLNESTLWSGGPVKTNVNPDAPSYLPQMKALAGAKHGKSISGQGCWMVIIPTC